MIDASIQGTFIPFRLTDVIEMCIRDGNLEEEDQKRFRTFCRILSAYYHYCFYERLKRLKDFFLPIDPDSPFKQAFPQSETQDTGQVETFFRDLENILKKANYQRLSQEDIQHSFEDQSLIQLKFDLDFDCMERYLLYYRGVRKTTSDIKPFPLYKKTITFDMLDRVILILKYKEKEYFQSAKFDLQKLNFKPGHTYLYLYKNIPINDLEILFPNVKIRMTWKDRLLFWIPAAGAGLAALSKIFSNLLIVMGFILFLLGFQSILHQWDIEINEEIINKSVYPLLVAVFSIVIVLGGFTVKQYLNYKNKFIQFMKTITDTLFFRNISINAGVFQNLIDSAEEEECKEAILSYYHLLTHPGTFTKPALDKHIENWFAMNFQTQLDFDVEDALEKLSHLTGSIKELMNHQTHRVKHALLHQDQDGTLSVLPLDQAILILDAIWDDLFLYNNEENTLFPS